MQNAREFVSDLKKKYVIAGTASRNIGEGVYVTPEFKVRLNVEAILKDETTLEARYKSTVSGIVNAMEASRPGTSFNGLIARPDLKRFTSIQEDEDVFVFFAVGAVLGIWMIRPMPVPRKQSVGDKLQWGAPRNALLFPYVVLLDSFL